MGRQSRQSIVDELDELGITFNENAPYGDLVRLLSEKKVALGVTEYKQGDNAIVKEKTAELPDLDLVKPSTSEKELPNGLIEIEVTEEEVISLQKEAKLVGYREEDNGGANAKRIVLKRFAIIRKMKGQK